MWKVFCTEKDILPYNQDQDKKTEQKIESNKNFEYLWNLIMYERATRWSGYTLYCGKDENIRL